jgi:hypothetical protein
MVRDSQPDWLITSSLEIVLPQVGNTHSSRYRAANMHLAATFIGEDEVIMPDPSATSPD